MNTTKEKTAVLFADINDDLLNLVFRKGLAFTVEDFNSGFGKTFKDIRSLRELKENCTLEDFDSKVRENQLEIEGVWCSTLNSILEECNLEVKVLGPDSIREKVFMASVKVLALILQISKTSQLMELMEIHRLMNGGKGSISSEVIKMTLLLSIYLLHVGVSNTIHAEGLLDKKGNVEEQGVKERVEELVDEMSATAFRLPDFLAEHLYSYFQGLNK